MNENWIGKKRWTFISSHIAFCVNGRVLEQFYFFFFVVFVVFLNPISVAHVHFLVHFCFANPTKKQNFFFDLSRPQYQLLNRKKPEESTNNNLTMGWLYIEKPKQNQRRFTITIPFGDPHSHFHRFLIFSAKTRIVLLNKQSAVYVNCFDEIVFLFFFKLILNVDLNDFSI